MHFNSTSCDMWNADSARNQLAGNQIRSECEAMRQALKEKATKEMCFNIVLKMCLTTGQLSL